MLNQPIHSENTTNMGEPILASNLLSSQADFIAHTIASCSGAEKSLKAKASQATKTAKKPYTKANKKSTSPLTSSFSVSTMTSIVTTASPSTASTTIQVKEEKMDKQMHESLNFLLPDQWLASSQIDDFINYLYLKNQQRDANYKLINPFGSCMLIYPIYFADQLEFQSHPGMVENDNIDRAFVIRAKQNHWIVLSNIDFRDLAFQHQHPTYSYDATIERNNWYCYDSLNDDTHVHDCSKVLEKLYPDMTGKRVKRVTVQQQKGANDCGLFACAFLDLLSQAKDPSQYTFNQLIMRDKFNFFLESKTFTGFASELKECETQTSIVIVDWETTWDSGLFLVLFDTKIIARLLLKSGN